MSNRRLTPNQSKINNCRLSNRVRTVIAAMWLSGGILSPGMMAWANGPAPGTVIENQATGSFVDPSDSSTKLIESNVVQVTVAEVAGITVINNGYTEPNDGTANEGDTVYVDFVIANVGNDPTQFVIPGAASITNGTSAGSIQIIEYDADGTGAGAAVDLSANNITVPGGGDTTGNLLNGVGSVNNGSIPAGGSITVRVPVTAGTGGLDLTVTLGDTVATDGQNEAYVTGSNDVYSQDNSGTDNGDTTGAPINGEREAEDSLTVAIAAVSSTNTISGTVFEDFGASGTGNNTPDTGENSLNDITLTLYRDDGDGLFDAASDTQITTTASNSTDGTYSFGVGSDGKYFVVLDHLDSDAPDSSIALPDRTVREVDVAGADVTDEDFPYDQLPPNLGSCPVDGIVSKNDPSDIFGVNLVTGNAQLLEEDLNIFDGSTTYVNGIGFSIVDAYVYGVNPRLSNISVVRLDGNYQATILGPIPGLSNTVNFNTGDVSRDGKLYLTTNGRSAFSIVDVNPTSPTYLQYLGDISFQNKPSSFSPDWAFHPADGQLYIIDADGSRDLNRVDPATGFVTNLGPTALPKGGFGAVFFDAAGYFYIADNNANITDGEPDPAPIYRIDVTDPSNPNPTAVFMGRGPTSAQNDGARCMDAPLPVDFGDAPDTGSGSGPGNYETLLSNNGPRHFIDGNTYLGSGVSSDTNGFVEGIDDNNNATDDADDAFASLADVPTTGTYDLTNIPVTNSTSDPATLHAWIDFDKDGVFESGEYQTATVNAGTSTASLSWTVPGSTTAGTTYARFRLTTDMLSDDGGTADVDERSLGGASDGEVEDYQVAISVAPASGSIGSPITTNTCDVSDIGSYSTQLVVGWNHNSEPRPTPDRYFGFNIDTNDFSNSGGNGVNTTYLSSATDEVIGSGFSRTSYTDALSSLTLYDAPGVGTSFSDAVASQSYVEMSMTTNGDIEPYLLDHIYFGQFDYGGYYDFKIIMSTDPSFGTYWDLGQFSLEEGAESRPFNIDKRQFDEPTYRYVGRSGYTDQKVYLQASTQYYFRAYLYNAQPPEAGQENGITWDDFQFGLGLCGDYGDANIGDDAVHAVYPTPDLFLGAVAGDADDTTQTSVLSNGDDTDGEDDEDGVTFPASIEKGETITLPVTVTGSGNLSAWVDWDTNGTFDLGEEIVTDAVDGGVGDTDSTTDGTITLSLTVPAGATAGNTYARFRYSSDTALTPEGTASDGEVEDYLVTVTASDPNVLLVKRITAINNDTTTSDGTNLAVHNATPYAYDDNDIPPVSELTNPAYDETDPNFDPYETDQWPTPLNIYMPGGTDGGNVMPNDEIEYTIYFLSSGDTTAENVLFCDYVPDFTTFIPNAYTGSTPQATGGIGGADLSIELFRNGTINYHTGANDGDSATYFVPGIDPANSFPGIDCDGDGNSTNTNSNGAVVVNLGNLPDATTDATGAYGYVKFRTRVK